jgi:hypothetical protein
LIVRRFFQSINGRKFMAKAGAMSLELACNRGQGPDARHQKLSERTDVKDFGASPPHNCINGNILYAMMTRNPKLLLT